MADQLNARSVALSLAALLCVAAVAQASAAQGREAEARDAAVSAATSVLDAALEAKPDETTEFQKAVRTTIDALAKLAKGGADDARLPPGRTGVRRDARDGHRHSYRS